MKHATLSPSSSARWMSCPGSVAMSKQAHLLFGEGNTSDPALKGTKLHDIAERMLLNQPVTPEQMTWVNAKGREEKITMTDIEEAVTPYVNFVRDLVGETGDLFVESKLTAHKQVWGTGDAVVIDDETLHVIDLKTGFGVVHAKDNTQLKIYALGAHKEFGFMYNYDTINVVISQGRMNHHSSYTYTIKEIEAFEEEMLLAIEAVEKEPEKLVTSEKGCQWCSARPICPEMADLVEKQTQTELKDMTMTQLSEAMSNLPVIKSWIKGIEDQVKQSLEKGETLPGWKMVQGRKSRRWTSVEAATKYFKNRVGKFQHTCFDMKLKSPAQMEKALRGEDVVIRGRCDPDVVTEYGHSAPTIVPQSDPRDALVYGDQAKEDFAGVDTDE